MILNTTQLRKFALKKLALWQLVWLVMATVTVIVGAVACDSGDNGGDPISSGADRDGITATDGWSWRGYGQPSGETSSLTSLSDDYAMSVSYDLSVGDKTITLNIGGGAYVKDDASDDEIAQAKTQTELYILFLRNRGDIDTAATTTLQGLMDGTLQGDYKLVKKGATDLRTFDGGTGGSTNWQVAISQKEYNDYRYIEALLITSNYTHTEDTAAQKHWAYHYKDYEIKPIVWRQLTVHFKDLNTDTEVQVSGTAFSVRGVVDSTGAEVYTPVTITGTGASNVRFYAPYNDRGRAYLQSGATSPLTGKKVAYWDYVYVQRESSDGVLTIELIDSTNPEFPLYREYQDDIRINYVNEATTLPGAFRNFQQLGWHGSRLHSEVVPEERRGSASSADRYLYLDIYQRFFPGERLYESTMPSDVPINTTFTADDYAKVSDVPPFIGNIKWPVFLAPNIANGNDTYTLLHPTNTTQAPTNKTVTPYIGLLIRIETRTDISIYSSGNLFNTMQYAYKLAALEFKTGYITDEY